jgi:hypothetical protein
MSAGVHDMFQQIPGVPNSWSVVIEETCLAAKIELLIPNQML